MKIRVPGMTGVTGFAIAAAIRGWMGTLRYEAHFDDPRADPAAGLGGPRIYLVWHEYMLAPIYLRAGCGVSILVSRHRDADLLEAIARHSGYDCVRGSTRRGGVAALRALVDRGRERHLVITPDGPRGPRRRLSPGPVYLASKLGVPIAPVGVGFERARRLRSWDRFAIPLPFSSARLCLGPLIRVSRGLDRAGLEEQRLRVEGGLNLATASAEAWAATGRRPPGAVAARREKRAIVPPPLAEGALPGGPVAA